MTKWAILSVLASCLVGVLAFVACSGGTGSSLNACPAASDITPGDVCVIGFACPSTQALPDCPGSVGSISCNCTATGWDCVDPHANPCFPDDAGDEAGDEGGGDEGGGDDGGSDAPDDTATPDDASDARAG
jgi:hypothetical protein